MSYPALPTQRAPVHPGLIVAEAIAATGVPKATVAKMIGLSRQSLHDILSGRASITPVVAVKIGKLLGNGPQVWIDLQGDYDVWFATQKTDVSAIETLVAAT